MGVDALPWRDAWHDALYAAGRGFYVTRGGPAEHFTTATHGVTGAALAEALLQLWLREHDQLPAVVVDVGAGRGELATHLLRALDAASPVEGALPGPTPVDGQSPTDESSADRSGRHSASWPSTSSSARKGSTSASAGCAPPAARPCPTSSPD